jgi:hypothetical protein
MAFERYPSQKELKDQFEIIDGILWRKPYVRSNRWRDNITYKATIVSNKPISDGYASLNYKKIALRYHAVVWILHYGEIPNGLQIDHIDGNRTNNAITNLRLVTPQENSCNKSIHRTGRLVGCYFQKASGKWMARARINGKRIYIGCFETEQQAHEKYTQFMKRSESCHIAK